MDKWSNYFKPDAIEDLMRPRPLPKFATRYRKSLEGPSLPCAYRLLGVSPLVAKDTINIVIKGLRQRCHPDKASTKAELAKFTKWTIRINSAVDHLRKHGRL